MNIILVKKPSKLKPDLRIKKVTLSAITIGIGLYFGGKNPTFV